MTLLQVLVETVIASILAFIFIKVVDIFSRFTIISKADLARYNTTVENYDELLYEKIILETLLWQVQQKKALGEVVESKEYITTQEKILQELQDVHGGL